MHYLVIPTTLFEPPETCTSITYLEEPEYMNECMHINKLILHRASMQAHYSMNKQGTKTKYYSINEAKQLYKCKSKFICYDPIDKHVKEKLRRHLTIEFLDSPGFLMSHDMMKEYNGKLNQTSFYFWLLKRLNMPRHIEKSYDPENRNKLPKEHEPPGWQNGDGNTSWVKDAWEYCRRNFPNALCLNTATFDYPICRQTAIQWLKDFIRFRLKLFGPYQDSIHPCGNTPIYHSTISSSLNIGLITPYDVISCLHACMTTSVPMNSYEGFVRQIVGWREYERYLYVHYSEDLRSSNYFNNKRRLDTSIWWRFEKNHPLELIHDALQYVRRDAYLSHIWRLMVLLNWMTLSEISPKETTDWFQRLFIDGYDWIMLPNCITMGYANTNFMRKPYLSSSNYIVKQATNGTYSRKDDWAKKWDELFKRFVNKKKDKLKHTVYIYQAD